MTKKAIHETVPATGGSVFMPGEEKLPERLKRAISPTEMAWGHRSVVGLSDALITIVDDEPANIELTQAFLEDAGYRHFDSTHRSETAIGRLRANPPSVLLLDLTMPRVGGIQILEQMRDDPVLRHVPVIVLTGVMDPALKLQALAMGAMDFLAKPVDPSELALRLRNTLAATAYRDFLANHDLATGLPNKLRYAKAVAERLLEAQERGHRGALIHVGIDQFTRINDALGQAAGDQLLQRIGKRLAGCVETEGGVELNEQRDSPSLYRFDGDQFAILLPCFSEMETAAAFIARLLEAAATSFVRSGQPEIFVTCSIGVAVFPHDGRTPDMLMTHAGLALRHAKAAGRHSYAFFAPELNRAAVGKLNLGADLSRALARNELELLYQPRIEVSSGKLMGAEAIARWKDPAGHLLEGDILLDLAATSDMSMALVEWVLDQLRRHTQAWREAGHTPVPVGVNVSLQRLPVAQLMDSVHNAIKAGVKPEHLCLELHEASTLNLRQEDVDAFVRIKRMGVRLALDHFGAGHSALSQLRRFPVDEVKVDALFFHKIDENKDNAAIVTALQAMARSLQLTFVATGINTLQQLAFLKAGKCDQCQGRVFNAPMPAAEFASRWLANEKN